ncbi:MAG: UDP-N-acetylmuramoyl-L-alanine--D-glutamate ligase [Rhodocyclaceae bacterium]
MKPANPNPETRNRQLSGRRALVLGLGESGLAMARWLARRGARVRVADTRVEPPFAQELRHAAAGVEIVSGPFSDALLDGVDLLGLSPGLAPGQAPIVAARARGIEVVGEIELFARALIELGWRAHTKVLAVTGTNGKTTVTSMLGEMCRSAGLTAAVAGNISPAALTVLMRCLDQGRPPRAWVMELSSFQLETMRSLAPDAAVVLNVSDDHLDRYRDLAEYAATKARIFRGAKAQVLNRQDARVMAMRGEGRRVLSFGLDAPPGEEDVGIIRRGGRRFLAQGAQALMPVSALALAGAHNVANAAAALAMCRAIGLPAGPLAEALSSFCGLPHRVERIARIGGVAFYDDSKGTNVGATLAALTGLGRKVALIAGGEGKGQDFSPLAPALARHARAVVLIGRDAPIIERAIAASGVPVFHAADMKAAVERAWASVGRGEAVLLSPACASFDMFRNYAHRAEVFADAVRALGARLMGERQ